MPCIIDMTNAHDFSIYLARLKAGVAMNHKKLGHTWLNNIWRATYFCIKLSSQRFGPLVEVTWCEVNIVIL